MMGVVQRAKGRSSVRLRVTVDVKPQQLNSRQQCNRRCVWGGCWEEGEGCFLSGIGGLVDDEVPEAETKPWSKALAYPLSSFWESFDWVACSFDLHNPVAAPKRKPGSVWGCPCAWAVTLHVRRRRSSPPAAAKSLSKGMWAACVLDTCFPGRAQWATLGQVNMPPAETVDSWRGHCRESSRIAGETGVKACSRESGGLQPSLITPPSFHSTVDRPQPCMVQAGRESGRLSTISRCPQRVQSSLCLPKAAVFAHLVAHLVAHHPVLHASMSVFRGRRHIFSLIWGSCSASDKAVNCERRSSLG